MTLGDAEFKESLIQGWTALLEGQVPNLALLAHDHAREMLRRVDLPVPFEQEALEECSTLCAELLLSVYQVALAQADVTAREALDAAFRADPVP